MSARVYDNFDKINIILKTLSRRYQVFYSLNKLRSWFCISTVEDTTTKNKNTLHGNESSENCYVKTTNIMLLMYIL